MLEPKTIQMLLEGIRDTLYMTLFSTLMGYVVGLPLGITLYVSAPEGLKPNRIIYRIIDFICNIVRSVPFLILLILLIPVTRAIVGQSYGSSATVVPLVICAAPYIARVVETALNEVDKGVIEAAQSMGANEFSIITKVLIPEAKPALLVGAVISLVTILGYSAMAGTIGGGGLGMIAITYGYQRFNNEIVWICVALTIIIVQLIQEIGMHIARRTDKRTA